jgi:hypothetical protein
MPLHFLWFVRSIGCDLSLNMKLRAVLFVYWNLVASMCSCAFADEVHVSYCRFITITILHFMLIRRLLC